MESGTEPTKRHKKVFFTHIPRTGGRFILYNLKKNGYINYGNYDEYDWMWGQECCYWTRPTYEKLFKEELKETMPHFGVVRDPLERYLSMKSYEIYPDDWIFFHVPASQWYRPMVDYVRDDTQIWKFEDGFGDEFQEWMRVLLDDKDFTLYDPPLYLKQGRPYSKHSMLEYKHPDYKKIEKTDEIEEYVKTNYAEDLTRWY
tara:strand:- start:358 stop:960 length:603 start_codon:yes stop_codon:yes gene_type:complete